MSLDTVPKELRQLRACLVCSLIKTIDQFEMDGCENCDSFLHMKDNRDHVYECTSNNFDGMVSLMCPEDSWVAKWQRINRFCKGVYAISVAGRPPNHVVTEMKRKGVIYRSRDKVIHGKRYLKYNGRFPCCLPEMRASPLRNIRVVYRIVHVP